jgi:hypothetical protein
MQPNVNRGELETNPSARKRHYSGQHWPASEPLPQITEWYRSAFGLQKTSRHPGTGVLIFARDSSGVINIIQSGVLGV